MIRSVIIGSGSCIPELTIKNESFINAAFFEKDGSKVYKSSKSVIRKFQDITGIAERRYAKPEQCTSDLAFLAAQHALEDAGINKETLDYLIVAHNFGDVAFERNRVDTVPTLAARVKALLKIKTPHCVAYDLPFGCSGWIEGMIQANYFIRSGDAKRCIVIGAETLSRVTDPHDRDSMIYGDGSGAVVLEGVTQAEQGLIAHQTRSYATDHAYLLRMDSSYSPYVENKQDLYLKMNGRKVYEFALNYVPLLIKDTLDKANVPIERVNTILIHQANDKMNHAILERLFRLYNLEQVPEGIMPMTISWLGNSSVATVPTLLDLIRRGKLEKHSFRQGDIVVMAAVGAGMNLNAIVYQF